MLKKITFLSFFILFYGNVFSQIHPININTIDELSKIGNDSNFPLNGYYILQHDLNFNDSNDYLVKSQFNNFAKSTWLGIGKLNDYLNNPFTGVFDGNNHIIKNWRTNTSDTYIGLFRNTLNATIKNLGLVNVNIQNGISVIGGLIGNATNTNIHNCFVTGSIFSLKTNNITFANTANLGGLVGIANNSKISNCFTNVNIGAANNVGGLVGQLNSFSPNASYIKNCFTSGKVQLLNSNAYSLLIGARIFTPPIKDSIINTYSVGKFLGKTPSNNAGGLMFGGSFDNNTNGYDTLYIKGCYSIENSIKPIKFDLTLGGIYHTAQTNKTYKLLDTVFTSATTKNFGALTDTLYKNTYFYESSNQQYPLLYKADTTILLGGQIALYPAVIEKTAGSINGIADSVKPIDNFTKNGNTRYKINNINGINNIEDSVFVYFSMDSINGTLSWIEETPNGEYLVEIRGTNDTVNSQSWIRIYINRGNDALVSVNAQSVQFTTKNLTQNGDYINIDYLNFINRNVTIESWVKMENNIGSWRRIFDFGTGNNNEGITLGYVTPNQLGFHANGADILINLPVDFNLFQWNHYALTLQSDSVKLYLNGTLIGAGLGAQPTHIFNSNFIGKSNNPADSCTSGRFSECRIWLNAHTQIQINALYNQKVPNNADSLYVYLPLTNNIYGEYPIISDGLVNASENIYEQAPNTTFHRNARASVKYIYDSNQQFVYGTLKTALANNEILQIAVKDSTIWDTVKNISNFLFSYILPKNFISGNIYVRSVINGLPTNRFGNTYKESKYYVDWVGTGLQLNPNTPYKSIPNYIFGTNFVVQRNKNKLADTFFNPLVGNFTDANQKFLLRSFNFVKEVFRFQNQIFTSINDGVYILYNDTAFSLYNYPSNHIKFAYNNGNTMIILNKNTTSGLYYPFNGLGVVNSLGQVNQGFNGTNFFDTRTFVIIYGDSLKAVKYNNKNYFTTAYKSSSSNIPIIVGNDSSTLGIRYTFLARRNGVNITNLYSFNAGSFEISSGNNRPIGIDSIFVSYQGIFNEILYDTLLFTYQLTKPKVIYLPNELKTYSLINKKGASYYPNVLDSGGGGLSYNLLPINVPNGVNINPKTGVISVNNWDSLPPDSIKIYIRVSNIINDDTIPFYIIKTSVNKGHYFSNSSYRTNSINGADYIQLPRIDLRNKAFGMDIWYKHNAKTGSWHRIIDIGTGANNQGIFIGFPDTTQIFVRTPNQSDFPIAIPANIQINKWNHYAISVDKTGRSYFYINGKLILDRLGGTTPQVIFNSNFIGKSNYGGLDAPSAGQFTDFRIWDDVIDSNIYNIRGINNLITDSLANLIYYLPLSLPVYNQNIPIENNYILKNAASNSSIILDSEAYIKGNSNTFNFDSDRIFLSGELAVSGNNKSIQATIYNYASESDTNTKTSFVSNTSFIKNNYWGIILPPEQSSKLNNQIVTITDSLADSTVYTYNHKINLLPNFITYLPTDTIKIQVGKNGYIYPKNDYIINQQIPFKYTFANMGGLNNVISLDTNTGKLSWTNSIAIGIYNIQINVTNQTGTIKINGVLMVGDSLKSIQYLIDSISVNYGIDSSNLPYTLGTNAYPTYSISVLPNNPNITIHPQNGKIYWNRNVPTGIYTITIKASNYLNTVYKTIKLNIKAISPRDLSYRTKINNYIVGGYDTNYVKINVQDINKGGDSILTYTANLPAGFRFEEFTGNIIGRYDSMVAGNYKVIVTATNSSNLVPNYTQDTLYINVQKTTRDTILGFKNAYMSFTIDANGSNGDFINLPTINLSNNFTIEAWVKLNDITRNYQRIFEAGFGPNNNMISIGTFSNTGRLFITVPTDSIGGAKTDIVDNTLRIINNTWFHIALVRDGVNAKLYLNGEKVIDMDFTTKLSFKEDLSDVSFGRSNYSTDVSTLGQMDEIRIWKKALLPNEIERYRLFSIFPSVDSLYFYLPLNKSLYVDSTIENNAKLQNQAMGKDALQFNATALGNGIKFSRDSTRQILYGTFDTTSTQNREILVRTQFAGLPTTADSTRNALTNSYLWATNYNSIPAQFKTGNFIVTKNAEEDTIKPGKYFVKYAPTNLFYNASNTIVVTNKNTAYYSNKPTLQQNLDSNSLVFSIPAGYNAISIDPNTGVIQLNADSVLKLYGKLIKLPVTASNFSGQTTSIISINIISANIIGYNNTSISLPNNNGADYIKVPSLDLRNSNFAIEVWFKLIGSPINNKRIFDFAAGTAGAERSGLILYFPANQLKFGAFAQDGLINLGNADTALKNGLNEWNKFSIFYDAISKTFYVYINGEFKQMATVATDLFTAPLISNFLANNNYADPITDGYFREFKVYKNLSHANFIDNLKYSITPNRADANLYYYLPLSNNIHNVTYIGNKYIQNNTFLYNKALDYNANAVKDSALLYTANNQAYYYGDSVNQFLEGEFGDTSANLRFSFAHGIAKDTVLPKVSSLNYVWRLNVQNFYSIFKVFNASDNTLADSINILLSPKLLYSTNNQKYPVVAGQSVNPTIIGSDTVIFSISNNTSEEISINAQTGVINWTNQTPAGRYNLHVFAKNSAGIDSFIYTFDLQDTLQGLRYFPDSIQTSASNTDSLSFLPTLIKGTGATYRILNPITGFDINAKNGRINWLNTVPIGEYIIKVEANNIYNLPVIDSIKIVLSNQAPSNLQYINDSLFYAQSVSSSTPRPTIVTGGLTVRYSIHNITPNTNSISIDSLTGIIKWVIGLVGNYSIQVKASNALGFILKTINLNIDSSTNILVGYNNGGLNVGKYFPKTPLNRIELPKFDFRNNDYTIESWVKVLHPAGTNNWRRIFEFGTGANSQGLVFGFQASNTIGMHSNTGNDIIMYYPPNYNPLNWNHYAITVSDSLRLYINGVLIKTAVGNRPNSIYDKNYLNISNWAGDSAGVNAYKDVRIWKLARNTEEIAQNYQVNLANNTLGLYYYLPLNISHYLPAEIVPIPNIVRAPELDDYYPAYKASIPNAAIQSELKDSAKIITYYTDAISSFYYTDSTQQKIYGNYAGELSIGEQLQYSIDSGNTWQNINFSQNNVFTQTIDSSFKSGFIKIRSIINNIQTNRTFNNLNVTVYPQAPTNCTATPNNNGTINVVFTPSKISSGVTIYKVYTSSGQLVATTMQSPVIIRGLNIGQSYQFKVTAVNELGESLASNLSNPVSSINILLQITTFTNFAKGVNITPSRNELVPYTDYRVTYQINPGYIFDSIIIDNVKNTDSLFGGYTFTNLNNGHSVIIYVSRIKFTISVSKNEGGIVNPNQSTLVVNYGDTTTLQIIPNNRFKIDSVFINDVYQINTANSYTLSNIQQNYSLRVVFKARVYNTILVEKVGNGNVNSIGLIEVETGSNFTLTYYPIIGNRLDSVLVNNTLVNDSTHSYTFNNIQSNVKIRLVFKIKTFTITALVKNGTVTPSGINTYNYGTQVNYNFLPTDNNYVLDSLFIDGVLQIDPDSALYTFNNLDTNHSIQIVFNLKSSIYFTININKTEGVTVTPPNTLKVVYGSNLQVTWVGNTGYLLDSIFVNGKYNRDSINRYTFTNVRREQSIYIKYKIKTFTITSSTGLHGAISPLGISIVNYGTNKSYILLPDIGYETDSLFINGTSVTKPLDNIYTFNNVTTNYSIMATFKVKITTIPCDATKLTPNIVRVGDALKSDITTFAKQRWYLAGTFKDSTLNNLYTPTEAGIYTLLGIDALGCESNLSKKYYYAKNCIIPSGRLGNGAFIQSSVIDNSNLIVVKWCTDIVQEILTIKILNLQGELIFEQKVPAKLGLYIINKAQIKTKNYVIEVIDNNGEVLQISDIVN